ncbi:MAG: N-acetylmuramic acid transporter subunit [Pantoea agglomerans]|nr:N-acetylmuramic acid transporter subunit [Pantoea agglomerans]
MARITEALLRDILQAVGGAQNIAACGHCMTRLRLTLNQPGESDLARLKSLPGVLGVIDSEAQLQIVLGPGKAQTAAEGMQNLLAQGDTALAPQGQTAELAAEAAAKGETDQRRASVPVALRHHLHSADSGLYRRGAAAGICHAD